MTNTDTNRNLLTEPDPTQPSSADTAGQPSSIPAGGILCEIQLQNPGRYGDVALRRLRPWLSNVVAALAPSAESLAIRFISDREMRRLNSTFRFQDKTTDVLSFPGEPNAHLGDIALSVPTARRQAAQLGHGVEHEIRTLLLHGLLHCLGYDHETDDGTMERLELEMRARFIHHG